MQRGARRLFPSELDFAMDFSKLPMPTISASRIEGSRTFLLIDGAQVPKLLAQLDRKRRYIAGYESLFDGTMEEGQTDVAPYLVETADSSTCGMLLKSLSGLLSHGALSVFATPLPRPELATRLRRRLDARLPDGFDCINRFFDGRVAPHLHACLRDNQRSVFFSTCDEWWVISHEHRWQSLACNFANDDPFQARLELDEKQQAYMIDSLYPYAVIEHFRETDEELLDTVPPQERYAFFRRALVVATQYGIDGGPPAILFCTLALTRGADFHLQPDWQPVLQRVKHGEISLAQAMKAHP